MPRGELRAVFDIVDHSLRGVTPERRASRDLASATTASEREAESEHAQRQRCVACGCARCRYATTATIRRR
jgi:hypothetical protein